MRRIEDAPGTPHPHVGELAFVVGAGTLHVSLELACSEATALRASAAIVVVVLVYLLWRVRRLPTILRAWGMRRDNFRACLPPFLAFTAVGALALAAVGAATGSFPLPGAFWLVLALYPLWGIAQQFALQNLLARNVEAIVSNPFAVACVAAILFGASHYPRLDLVALTLVSGFVFTLLYRRYPNLWAVGISHGVLGSLAVYLILREDPGAAILGALAAR